MRILLMMLLLTGCVHAQTVDLKTQVKQFNDVAGIKNSVETNKYTVKE